MNMFLLTLTIVFIGLCKLEGTTGAVTAWSKPTITTKDGQGTLTLKLREDHEAGTDTPLRVQATGTSKLTYSLVTATSHGVTFSIDSNKLLPFSIKQGMGLLTLESGTLDFETNPSLVLVVKAAELGTTNTGTATVTINLEDVNEKPVFTPTSDGVVALHGAGEGTVIATANATDPDVGNTLTYTITSGNTDTMFTIGASTGQITVSKSKSLDMTKVSFYTLGITASDNDNSPLSGVLTLAVVVTSTCSGVAMLTVSMATVTMTSVIALLI